MKNIKTVFLIGLLAVILAACGGGTKSGNGSTGNNNEEIVNEEGGSQFVVARKSIHEMALGACSIIDCGESETKKHVRGTDSVFRVETTEKYKLVNGLKKLPAG